ncbi:MAG: hypothetical protein GY856_42475, partial [bacterium]|nr:hypothetical protein [bacterium]
MPPNYAQIANTTRTAAANAGALQEANRRQAAQAPQTSAFDVWTHTYQGLADRVQSGRFESAADVDRAIAQGLTGEWSHSAPGEMGDALSGQVADVSKQLQSISKADGALATVGATFAFLTSIEQLISVPFSMIPFPAFPALRVTDMDVGLPHGHSHPPNLVPPAPLILLPSTGPIIPIPLLSGASRTLINGLPAARCGDMGLGIWCGGYFPMYEVFLGSSNVWIEGARAGRLGVDITKHCTFTSPKPSDPPLGPMIGTTLSGSPNVLIGGVPMPSLLSLAMGAAFKALFKGLGKVARKLQSTRLAQRVSNRLQRAADNLIPPGALRNRVKRTICTVTGHPVDVATGKVFTEAVDLELPGPLPFRFERVWYSTSTHEGPLGHGWHHSCDMSLMATADVVVVRLADGRYASFEPPEEGRPSWNVQEKLTLHWSRGAYVLAEETRGLRYHFAAASDRRGEETLAGQGQEALLSRIEDRNRNRIQLVRREGRLVQIVDSAGRELP